MGSDPKFGSDPIIRIFMSSLNGVGLSISKKIGKAIMDYNMLTDGDKICVAVSGGKDSLTLLKMLQERKKFIPIKYDLLAVHVDMGYPCQHPKILSEYFKKEGVEYYIEKINILKPGQTRKDITFPFSSQKTTPIPAGPGFPLLPPSV